MISSTRTWLRKGTVKGNYSTAFHNLKRMLVNRVPALLWDHSKALTLLCYSHAIGVVYGKGTSGTAKGALSKCGQQTPKCSQYDGAQNQLQKLW